MMTTVVADVKHRKRCGGIVRRGGFRGDRRKSFRIRLLGNVVLAIDRSGNYRDTRVRKSPDGIFRVIRRSVVAARASGPRVLGHRDGGTLVAEDPPAPVPIRGRGRLLRRRV